MSERRLENWPGNPKESIDITGRNSEIVIEELSLDLNAQPHGANVLILGEGFSDFGVKLQEQRQDLSILVADQLYAYVHPTDSPDVIKQKLKSVGINAYVSQTSALADASKKVSSSEKQPMYVAADIYKLPLADASIDVVYLNHVLEHIAFDKALPELVRVLKQRGEIRFGGTPFTISNQDGILKMYLGLLKNDLYDGTILIGPDLTSFEAGVRVLATIPEVTAYVHSTQTTTPFFTTQTFVLKKGDDIPVFFHQSETPSPRTFRLLVEKINTDDPQLPYVELTQSPVDKTDG